MLRPGSRLVLASGSATRRAMLAAAGLDAESVTPGVDEAEVKAAARADRLAAEETALLLAELKAARVTRHRPDALVIGADQLLVCGEDWFDKPPDLAAARAQLAALRGRSHRLVTAVVVSRGGNRLWHHLATPILAMRGFSDAFLDAYLALEGERVLGSVGAYRLEGPGVHLFERIEGDHFSILGLPLLPLLGFLRQHGVLMD
jgi:septum formation protein